MKIPNEILEKYNVPTDREERGTYETFLKATDYYIIKAFETLMSNPTSFLTNLVTIAKENAEVMQYRTIARTELATMVDTVTEEEDEDK